MGEFKSHSGRGKLDPSAQKGETTLFCDQPSDLIGREKTHKTAVHQPPIIGKINQGILLKECPSGPSDVLEPL